LFGISEQLNPYPVLLPQKYVTERFKEYIIKGFMMDGERLKNLGGGNIENG